MDCASVTHAEIRGGFRKSHGRLAGLAVLVCVASLSCSGSMPAQPSTSSTPAPAGPPTPLEGATISIARTGFRLDSAAAAFTLADIHIYRGGRLTFVNTDDTP